MFFRVVAGFARIRALLESLNSCESSYENPSRRCPTCPARVEQLGSCLEKPYFLAIAEVIMPSEPDSGPDPKYSVEVNPEGVRAKRPEGEHADSVTPWGEPADAAPTSAQPSDTVPANPSPADPNFLGMAVSAAKSMAQFAASGFQRVSPEDHELRLEQCSQCSQLARTGSASERSSASRRWVTSNMT